MHLRSGLGEDDRQQNIGLIYNYKKLANQTIIYKHTRSNCR